MRTDRQRAHRRIVGVRQQWRPGAPHVRILHAADQPSACTRGELPDGLIRERAGTGRMPAPVLWRDPGPTVPDPGADPERCDAVLSAGEVAILASAGGIGKSTLVAAELVSAALTGADLGTDYGAACGLRVVPGPVALVSYEDAAVRLARRLTWPNNGKAPPGLYSWPNPPSLWVADHGAGSRPCASGRRYGATSATWVPGWW